MKTKKQIVGGKMVRIELENNINNHNNKNNKKHNNVINQGWDYNSNTKWKELNLRNKDGFSIKLKSPEAFSIQSHTCIWIYLSLSLYVCVCVCYQELQNWDHRWESNIYKQNFNFDLILPISMFKNIAYFQCFCVPQKFEMFLKNQ